MYAYLLSLALTLTPAPDSTQVIEPVRVQGRRQVHAAPVFTLNRHWLKTKHPLDMREALAGVSGLRLLQLGTGEALPTIRGLGPNRVAVLVDGRPLNTAQGGGVDLSAMDPESLERIEIARGAVGALYGPYAMGGAINFVRRKNAGDTHSLRLLGGGQNTARVRGHLNRRRHNTEWHLGGDGYRFDEGGTPSWSRTLWLNTRRHLNSGATLEGVASWYGDHRMVPGSRTSPTPQAVREDERVELSAALGGLQLPFGIGDSDMFLQRSRRNYKNPTAPLGAIHDTHVNDTVRWANTLELSPDHFWKSEVTHSHLNSTTDGNRNRWQGSLSVQRHVHPGSWQLSGAGRVDWLESFAPATSARVHVERTLGPGLVARGGTGTAFRAPSFDDLFWPARASAAGNPNLLPERAYDFNLGFLLQKTRMQVEVTGYTMMVHDWIQWTPGVDGIWRPHNTDSVHLYGIETSATLDLSSPLPRMDFSYTWSESRDATDDPITQGKALVGRPQHRLFAEGRWRWDRITFGAGAHYVSAIPLTAANTKWQPAYTLVHTLVHVRLNRTLLLEVEGKNLFDTLYEDVRGYATRGREIFLGVTWRTDPS